MRVFVKRDRLGRAIVCLNIGNTFFHAFKFIDGTYIIFVQKTSYLRGRFLVTKDLVVSLLTEGGLHQQTEVISPQLYLDVKLMELAAVPPRTKEIF